MTCVISLESELEDEPELDESVIPTVKVYNPTSVKVTFNGQEIQGFADTREWWLEPEELPLGPVSSYGTITLTSVDK